MRSSKSRSRNKSNRQRTLGNIVNRVFDSSGPEGKVRGTPQQIIEKYLTLARDAQLSNDRVAEQSFLQHAEHYTRMLGEAQREMAERQQHQQGNPRQNGYGDDENGQNREGGQARDGGQSGRESNDRNDRAERQDRNDRAERQDRNDRGERQDRGERPDRGGRDQGRRPDQDVSPHAGSDGDQGDDSDAPTQVDSAATPQPQQRAERRSKPAPAAVPDATLPDFALPDAVAHGDDERAAPVETPESEPAPKPARAPRPRTPRSATGRTRRKPADGGGDQDTAEAQPADEGGDNS